MMQMKHAMRLVMMHAMRLVMRMQMNDGTRLVMRLVMMTYYDFLTSPLLQLSLLDVFEFSFQ